MQISPSRSYAAVAVLALAGGPSSAAPAATPVAATPVAAAPVAAQAAPAPLRLTDAHAVRFTAALGSDFERIPTLSTFHVPASTRRSKLVLTASVQARTSRGDRGSFSAHVRPVNGHSTSSSLRPGAYAVDLPNGSTTSFVWVGTVPPSTSGYSVEMDARALSEGEGQDREARLDGRRWAAVLDVTPVP